MNLANVDGRLNEAMLQIQTAQNERRLANEALLQAQQERDQSREALARERLRNQDQPRNQELVAIEQQRNHLLVQLIEPARGAQANASSLDRRIEALARFQGMTGEAIDLLDQAIRSMPAQGLTTRQLEMVRQILQAQNDTQRNIVHVFSQHSAVRQAQNINLNNQLVQAQA